MHKSSYAFLGSLVAIPKVCATPTISYKNGCFTYYCETDGADIHHDTVVEQDAKGNVALIATAYAIAEGYQQSETATLNVNLADQKVADVNGDGEIKAINKDNFLQE